MTVAGGEAPADSTPRAPEQAAKNAGDDAGIEWSIPMSKAEMAKRLTGDPNARSRKVEALLARYGLEQVSPRQWRVRLDKMDMASRAKVEDPKPH